MFIHRNDADDPTVKGRADLIVAKHRNGPTDTVKLSFLRRYAKFSDLAAA
jgi:replicative DNA helicase